MTRKPFKIALYLMAIFFFLSQSVFALNIVELSPGYYPNASKGRPLGLAYIYVGTPDTDPTVVANQKTLSVQQEDGTIVAVAQPIRTNAGGVPTYLGESVVLLVEGDYSLAVLDSSSTQIYYVPSTAYEQYLIAGNYYYPDYSEADQGVVSVGAGSTVTDILTTVGAVTNATLYFSHDSGAATTTYTFTTATTITDNITVVKERGVLFAGTLIIEDPGPPLPHRSTFRWKDGDEIYIGAASYDHAGSTRQTVYWNSEITFHLESTGSNALSDNYGADGWHYIYLDDSAIITQGVPLLDADCFLNETTAPTWSIAKHGWYNGNDKCIAAVFESGGGCYEFFHDGGRYILFKDKFVLTGINDTDIATDWSTEGTYNVPAFVSKVNTTFVYNYVDTTSTAHWRTEGQAGATGHLIGEVVAAETTFRTLTTDVMISSNLKVDVKDENAATNTMSAYWNGWYFPNGM